MNDVAQKVADRAYQNPGRARAAVARAHLSPQKKRALGVAIQRWEDEGSLEPPVIGALPPGSASEVHEAELVDREPEPPRVNGAAVNGTNGHRTSSKGPQSVTLPAALNLNAFIRARLTPYGMHVLYTKRKEVPVPDDLLAKGCVWETSLAHFMIAFGQHLEGPDNEVPVDRFEIELVQLRP